jgi:hypothetical protein
METRVYTPGEAVSKANKSTLGRCIVRFPNQILNYQD